MSAADVLIGETLFMVVAAPLAGVALAARRAVPSDSHRHPRAWRLWRLAWPLVAGASLYAATAAALAVSLSTREPTVFPIIAASHAALWAATLAHAAFGAFCGSLFHDVLDAAAGAVGIAAVAAAGVLVGGPGLADAPIAVINAALQASPIVAIASAADMDLLRMDLLYRLSPLAHMRVDYPGWQATCGWFAAAAVLFAATTCMLHRTPAQHSEGTF